MSPFELVPCLAEILHQTSALVQWLNVLEAMSSPTTTTAVSD